jgi:hypothetical protein
MPTNIATPGPVETAIATPTPSGVFDLQDNGASPVTNCDPTNSCTATLPSAPSSGNVVLVFGALQSLHGNSIVVTGPTGGTLVASCNVANANYAYIWSVPDTGSLANSFNVSSNLSDGTINVGVMEIAHLASTAAPTITAQNCTNAAEVFSPGLMTPSASGSLPIGFFTMTNTNINFQTFFNPSNYQVPLQYTNSSYEPFEVIYGPLTPNTTPLQIGDGVTTVGLQGSNLAGISLLIGP